MQQQVAADLLNSARVRMRDAARRRGLRTMTIDGSPPLQGDVIRIGRRRAQRAMVLCSGAPGLRGLLPLRLYAHLVEHAPQLPDNVEILIVSAANPAGPPWPVLEIPPLPPDALWDENIPIQELGVLYNDHLREHAPDAPASGWSRESLEEIAAALLSRVRIAVGIDFRDSLCRDFMVSVVSCDPPGSRGHRLASRWVQRLESPEFYNKHVENGILPTCGPLALLRTAQSVNLRIEFGTYTLQRLFHSLAHSPGVRSPDVSALGEDWWQVVEPRASELIITLCQRLSALPLSDDPAA